MNWLRRLWEPFEDPTKAAERRWTQRNAEQPKVCHCGQPGLYQVYSHGQVGNVPPMWWRCEQHYDVPLECHWSMWPSWPDGRPIPPMVTSSVRRPDGFYDLETRPPTDDELANHPWYYHLRIKVVS